MKAVVSAAAAHVGESDFARKRSNAGEFVERAIPIVLATTVLCGLCAVAFGLVD